MPTVATKKTTRAVVPRRASKRRPKLAPITPASPLYGHDDIIGCVSIPVPATTAARRAQIAARIHADNHS